MIIELEKRMILEWKALLRRGEGGEGRRGEMDSQTPSARVHLANLNISRHKKNS